MTTFETKDNVEENNDKNITKIINIDHNISADKRKKIITNLRKDMVKAAKELDFIEAARLRDLITSYKKSG
jgi:excinuclease ABC subunit B